jgi:uncharacterized protein
MNAALRTRQRQHHQYEDKTMKRPLLMLACVGALLANPAFAGPFEDAMFAYENGDYVKAVGMLKPLAEQGNVTAQATLGLLYDTGYGVPHDLDEAVKWYRMAALQGDKSARYNLGQMYDTGQGVPQDVVRAYMWFALSLASGNDTAAADRDAMAKKMSTKQIAEAKAMVAACQKDSKACS